MFHYQTTFQTELASLLSLTGILTHGGFHADYKFSPRHSCNRDCCRSPDVREKIFTVPQSCLRQWDSQRAAGISNDVRSARLRPYSKIFRWLHSFKPTIFSVGTATAMSRRKSTKSRVFMMRGAAATNSATAVAPFNNPAVLHS